MEPFWRFFVPRVPVDNLEGPDAARVRRDMLAEAALALAGTGADGAIEPVLRLTVEAAARITDAAAAVVLTDGAGSVERFAAQGLDGCSRDTLTRPEMLRALLGRLPTLRRPLEIDDLDSRLAHTLRAVAPGGIVVLAIDETSFLALLEPTAEDSIAADAVAVASTLAGLAAATFERARAVASVIASCAELRRLCTDVLARQDDERGRTARELHEGICQRLAAANAQLEALAAVLDTQRGALARLRDARALLNQTLGELRELAQGLSPSVLENLGYLEALRWYLGRLRQREGVALSFEVEGAETRLPLDMESALYRATEEALGPAAEARGPRRVRVRYRREPKAVRIEIAGTPPEAVDLVAIRERLRPFGGAVQVSSAPDHAPVIEVQVPARVN